jgi:hypothetical protein
LLFEGYFDAAHDSQGVSRSGQKRRFGCVPAGQIVS